MSILLLVQCNTKKPSLGTLQISFQFNKAVQDVEPSYQIAVWLEDVQGDYAKTLFLSEYLSYGGYNDSTICPAWNSVADWDNAPMEAYDAVTRATPPLGENFLEFGLDSLGLDASEYICCVQAHIIEDYNILFENRIDISKAGDAVGKAIFEPQAFPGAEAILAKVTAHVIKN